jgi:hypothetical protein
MDFRLVYDGPLKAHRDIKHKQALRRHFHVQLRELVQRKSMEHFKRLIEQDHELATFIDIHDFRFAPLIAEKLNLIAKLHITLLTPEEPGRAISQGGDIDNRLKTLVDALRAPQAESEIPPNDKPRAGENPFFCLLEDDALVGGISVISDRLLRPNENPSNVVLVIHVIPESTQASLGTITWTMA